MPLESDPILNETLKETGKKNKLPRGDSVDLWSDLAGKRLLADRAFMAAEGFSNESLAEIGLSLEDLPKHRKDLRQILMAMVRTDGRRPSRRRHRAAAIRLLGHLKMSEAAGLLTEVLESDQELPTHRAAAADALGLMEAKKAFPTLKRFIADESPLIRKASTRALGKVGELDTIELLRRTHARDPELIAPETLRRAVREVERRGGVETTVPFWVRRGDVQRQTTTEVTINVPPQQDLEG